VCAPKYRSDRKLKDGRKLTRSSLVWGERVSGYDSARFCTRDFSPAVGVDTLGLLVLLEEFFSLEAEQPYRRYQNRD